MKIIEGLKKIKDLQRKADDLCQLVNQNCVRSSLESDKYPEQGKKVAGWIQSHSDIMKEILRLRIAIQNTNLSTKVKIEIDDKNIEKSIAEWIHRRRDLAASELKMWKQLTDRNIHEGTIKGPSDGLVEVRIIRFYEPDTRDKKIDLYQSEPMIIDSRLEVINAITDLIE